MRVQMQKIAIITGGSRGLGRSEVLSIAERGTNCIFTYNSKREEADQVVEAASAHGVKVRALQLDLGKVSTFDAFVDGVRSVLNQMGVERFDYLVNNAGILRQSKFGDVKEEDPDRQYSINFTGVLFLMQKLLPFINAGGRIINVGSSSTAFAMPGLGL